MIKVLTNGVVTDRLADTVLISDEPGSHEYT